MEDDGKGNETGGKTKVGSGMSVRILEEVSSEAGCGTMLDSVMIMGIFEETGSETGGVTEVGSGMRVGILDEAGIEAGS